MPEPILMDISDPRFIDWLEKTALPGWFGLQRWFARKTGEKPLELRLQELGISVDGLILGLVDADLQSQADSPYLIALIFVKQGDMADLPENAILGRVPEELGCKSLVLIDAAATEQGRMALLKIATSQSSVGWSCGSVRGRVFEKKQMDSSIEAWKSSSQWLGVEQSNTSLVFGEDVILKILRRPGRPGLPNPDAEIPLALSLTTAEPMTPSVMGVIQAGDDPSGMMIATLCRYLKGSVSGWDLARQAVTEFVQKGGLPSTQSSGISIDEILQRDLAICTAQLHQALAKIPDNEAFKPLPIRADEIQRLGLSLRTGAEAVFDQLRGWNDQGLPLHLVALMERVIANQKRYTAAFERLEKFTPGYEGQTLLFTIRHHGDYHLGQVLWDSSKVWQVIDFEGEPNKSLANRRDKAIGLRDIAGMVRSFDYAQAVAMREMDADLDQKRLAMDWRERISFTFSNTYFAMVGELENEIFPLIPESYPLRYQLMDAFILEKNLYELIYELEHRPDWAEIPLEGLLSWLE